MNLILLLFSIVAFATFTMWVGFTYGVQKSISASIHVLQGNFEKSMYSVFILCIAFPMAIVSGNAWGFFAGGLLGFDAAAPAGGPKLQYWVHCIGADLGMILGMCMLGSFGLWWLVGITLLSILFMWAWRIKNYVWWAETLVFVSCTLGLFIVKVF